MESSDVVIDLNGDVEQDVTMVVFANEALTDDKWNQMSPGEMLTPYLLPMELPESNLRSLSDYAMSFVKRSDYNLLSVLHDINQAIYHDYTYVPGVTNLETTPYDVFQKRRGVYQDSAKVAVKKRCLWWLR